MIFSPDAMSEGSTSALTAPRRATRARQTRDARRDERRRQILDAALTLFAERGYDATATKAVAERAGVPSGLVFYYFSSKQELLMSVLAERSVATELQSSLTELSGADPRFVLATAGQRMLSALGEQRDYVVLLFREFHTHPEVAARLRALRHVGAGLVAAYLNDAVRAGQLRPLDAETVAGAFLASIFIADFLDRPGDPNAQMTAIADALLGGYLMPTDPPRLQ